MGIDKQASSMQTQTARLFRQHLASADAHPH
jgi:hypothetical protein